MFKILQTLALAAVAAVALAASGSTASALTFTFSNGGGDGTGTTLNAGAFDFAAAMTSNDNGVPGIYSMWTATTGAQETASVDGFWNYATQDIDGSSFDIYGYFIGNTYTQLSFDGIAAPAIQGGAFAFNVGTNTSFGWYMVATDGILGSANTSTFANIDVAAVPLPAGGLLLIGAVGGLAALRRRKALAA